MHDPERYESNKACAGTDAAEFVPLLINGMTWKTGEKILDYGCGAGSVCKKYLVPMAQIHGSTIDAIDISEEMVTFAKENNSDPLVTYRTGNILSPNFLLKGQKYDKIFLIYVIHYVKDYRQLLQKLSHLLNPGGQLAFTVIGKGTHFNLMDRFGKSEKWSMYMKGYDEYIPSWYENKEEAEDVLKKALLDMEFTVSKIQTERKSQTFTLDHWTGMFVALNPYVKQIPVNLFSEFQEDYRTNVRDLSHPAAENKRTIDYEMAYVIANASTALTF